MDRTIRKTASKFTSVLLSVATIGWLAGASALVPTVASADTTSDTIAALQAQIAALSAQLAALSAGSSGSAGACGFSRSLTLGAKGDDVTCLQNYLKGTGHFTYAGGATGYFGNVTKNAVAAWQAANGVSPAVGYFGSISRAKYASLTAGTTTGGGTSTGGTPAGTPAASGTLKVEAGTQVAASLFPTNSTRVPFTVLKFTAPADTDVTVNSLVVERTGLANDAAFSGIVLLDETGTQLGIAKTLNSSHQTSLTEAFTVKAGTSRMMTVAGNAQTTNGGYGGQIAYLTLASVNSSATIAGTLPITGTGHTVNETLTIGSVTMLRGSTDPGSSQTKEVGVTGYTFSAVKVTAGSAEKVYLKSIRWNQTGSVGSGDLANVKTYVEGTAYDTTVSSDGKYYTALFGDNAGKGILIDKGFSKELSIKGDVVGGSGRTVDFDLAKRTDIGLVGENYGYGITPPATGASDPTDDTAAFSSVEDPWYDAAQVTVSAGTMNVSTSNKAPAQNIAINLANQPLGAFSVDVKGESISVGRLGFNVTLGSEGANDDVDDITNVVLVDEAGAIVAGPVDGTAADSANTTSSGDGSIVFTDTVTFPVGVKNYILKGKIGTDIDNNVTITASTTPSADFAGTVRGLITGNTITPSPTSAITFNAMTVKSGSLTVSVSSVPIAQTVIANTKAFEFARYIIDAGSSGEDIRLTTIPLVYGVANGSATDLNNCQLFDGSVSVTTGSNTKNPTAQSSSTSFTFDGTGLVIPKGTSKTIALKCDLIGGATGGYIWGLDTAQATDFTGATGLTSGQTITETLNESNGQLMTAAAGGTLVAALDADSPGYKVVNAGATGVELAKIRFSAGNEDIDLKQVALQLSGGASNTPVDLVGRKVTLWDGATQIGEATFPTEDFATSSALTNFKVPKDGYKTLTVKGDIAAITNSGPLTTSGDLLIVNYDGGNTGLNGSYGTGASSGSPISPTGADTDSSGARVFKAYPVLTYIALSDRTLSAGTATKVLYKWSVKAVGGDVAIYKFSFNISSSTAPAGQAGATTSLLSVYAYTDSGFSSEDTTFSSDGLLNDNQVYCAGVAGNQMQNQTGGASVIRSCGTAAGLANGGDSVDIYMEKDDANNNNATTTYTVPNGATRYFQLKATVASVENVTGTESFTVAMNGDAAFARPSAASGGHSDTRTGNMFKATTTDRDTNNDFVWTPISTTTSVSFDDIDFANGYLLPGLPTSNMPVETLTSS